MAKPKRTARRARPTPVQHYAFYVTAEMTAGFTALGPRGGFSDGSVPHFLELRCLACGESTERDVCLYVLAPNTPPCTQFYGARRVTGACYPKCPNDAHLVRKCQCGRLGSVELTLPASEMEQDPAPVMMAECVGYSPVSYAPGPGWAATTTGGRSMDISYSEGNIFYFDEQAEENIAVGVVTFEFVKA